MRGTRRNYNQLKIMLFRRRIIIRLKQLSVGIEIERNILGQVSQLTPRLGTFVKPGTVFLRHVVHVQCHRNQTSPKINPFYYIGLAWSTIIAPFVQEVQAAQTIDSPLNDCALSGIGAPVTHSGSTLLGLPCFVALDSMTHLLSLPNVVDNVTQILEL